MSPSPLCKLGRLLTSYGSRQRIVKTCLLLGISLSKNLKQTEWIVFNLANTNCQRTNEVWDIRRVKFMPAGIYKYWKIFCEWKQRKSNIFWCTGHQPRPQGPFAWLWMWGPTSKAREKRPGDEVDQTRKWQTASYQIFTVGLGGVKKVTKHFLVPPSTKHSPEPRSC